MQNSSWLLDDARYVLLPGVSMESFFLIISILWTWPWLRRLLLQLRCCNKNMDDLYGMLEVVDVLRGPSQFIQGTVGAH